MIDERLAECLAAARIGGGDFLRAGRRSEPPHAMREPRRAEPHLRIAETLAARAEHMVLRDAKLVDGDHRVPAGHRAVDRVEQSLDAHGGVREVDETEAGTIIRTRPPDADRRALRTGTEGLAAVDDPEIGRAHV